MPTQNSSNQKYSNNADGFTLGGGTTQRNFSISGGNITLTNSGTQSYVMPASSDTLIGRASTDTLTNKTLTAPVLSGTITGTYTLGGTPTFPSTVVTTTGTQTLTNKTLTSPVATAVSIGSSQSSSNYIEFQKTAISSESNLPRIRSDSVIGAGFGNDLVLSARSTTGGVVFETGNTGVRQLALNASGALLFGTNGDTNLFRSAANTLKTDDNFIVGTAGTVAGSAVTIDGTQTLTDKTISGSSNTLSNIPVSAVTGLSTDFSKLVVTTADGGTGTEDGADTWAKIATFSTGTSQNHDCNLILAVSMGRSSSHDSAIISVKFRSGATSANPTVGVEMLAKGGNGSLIDDDSFKVISDGWTSDMELWMRKGHTFGTFYIYEMSRAINGASTLTYTTTPAWQSATPAGSVNNVSTSGVSASGVPVTTASNTQTLTNKTLTTPQIDSIRDTAFNTTVAVFSGISGGSDYWRFYNHNAGLLNMQAMGSSTNIGVRLNPKGSGVIQVYADSGQTPTILAAGADSNRNLNLTTSGTGVIQANGVEVSTISGTQTLTNKTITAPVLSGTITGTYTLGGTPTFPSTVVTTNGTQTLTNKTLTTPVISSISNSGTLTLPTGTQTLVGRTTADTLTNKTMSGSSNTFSNIPQSAVTNLATDLSGKADASHKYHTFVDGDYYFDPYTQSRNLRLFTENPTYTTTRFKTPVEVEYHNGSSWVAWAGGDSEIKKLLDGREETQSAIDHTHRRFRFKLLAQSYPTQTLWMVQTSWSAISFPDVSMNVSTSSTQGGTYTLRDTATFNSSNGSTTWGMSVYATSTLHTAEAWYQIEIEWTDWTDSGAYTTVPMRRIEILSNYQGSSLLPFSWNWDKHLSGLNKVVLPTGTTNDIGIDFGTDTNLYRSAANTLRTDDNLIVGTVGTSAGSAVTIDGTQTLTNKTITAPVLSGTVTGTYTLGGTPTFPSTVVTTTGTQTLTNKSLTDPFITGALDYNDVVGKKLMLYGSDSYAIGVESSEFRFSMSSGATYRFYSGSYSAGTEIMSLTNAGLLTTSGEIRAGTAGTQTNSVVTNAGTQTLSNKTLSAPVLTGTGELTGVLNFTPDTGTILAFDGSPAITRHGGGNSLSMGIGADDTLYLGAGESRSVMASNITPGPENVEIGGDTAVSIHVSTDNWANWANRKTTSFTGTGITWDGNEVWHDGNHSLNDVSKLVCDTQGGSTGVEDGANTWAKILTYSTGTNQYSDAAVILAVSNEESGEHDTAIVSVKFRAGATSSNPVVDVQMLAKGGTGTHIQSDSFKVISGGWSTDMELWFRKGANYGHFRFYELSANAEHTLTYETSPAWQSATPTGSVNNVGSNGVTAFGQTIWHAGNDGSGSGLDADLLDGMDSATAATVSTIMARDSNGDANVRYLHSQYVETTHSTGTRNSDTIFYSSTDNYIRRNNATGFKTSLSLENVDNTSDATKNSATATLTNKTLTDPALSGAIDFVDTTGKKLMLYNTDHYVIGIESSEFRFSMNTGAAYRFYTGGYDAGTEVMSLTSAGLLTTLGEIRAGTAGTQTNSVVTNAGTQTLTNKTLSSPTFTGSYSFGGTPTWPTFNQNTTGNAATATTATNQSGGTVSATTGDFSTYARTNEVRTLGGQQIVINAGEAHAQATGQTGEFVYLNAESGLQINSSPDNWSSAWAGRVTTTIDSSGITWNGNTVWHAGNDGSGSGLDADTLDGLQASSFTTSSDLLTISASLRANRNLNGGGTITVDGSWYVHWSARFIVIANGRGSYFGTGGYFDINCPTSGTITGVGGSSNKTATSAGIPLDTWEALYYILPIGSGSGSISANFRVARYTADVDIPHDWLLICIRNGDSPSVVTFNNGITLSAGQSMSKIQQDNANTANTLVRRDASGDFTAGIITANRYTSTVSTGTAPFTVSSTTAVTNLNADLLDGQHASAFAASSHTHTIANITSLQTTLDGKAASSHTHTATNISDSTATGRAVLTAASASAARSAIGAGTGDGDVTTSGAQTLTNKRINPRVGATASSATPSINTDSVDKYNITALATNITSMTSSLSGTPVDGQKLMVRIKDNGTPRSITWGASWRGMGVTLPIVTTASKTLYIGATYNSTDSIWDVIAVEQEA